MNNNIKAIFKPIAFSFSKEKIDSEFSFFSKKINLFTTQVKDWHLNLWYIGEIEKAIDSELNFSFSFPKSNNLLDRNLIISETNGRISIENDWLGSIPVFYNKSGHIVSSIPNLCLKDKLFDEEGLVNFLDFGYSVFERTPFKDVEFLRYYSTLIIEEDVIKIEYKDDPVLDLELFIKPSTTNEAINLIKEYITKVEDKVLGDIIIPTSGGYDSRLLNWSIKDKSRIRSFTYGISKIQGKSREVVFAEKISEILNIKWKQIKLSNFNNYIKDWHKLFGFSTHLHGMYHIEFYKKIISMKGFNNRSTLLSGIIGDAWAGSINVSEVSSDKDVVKLGYSHGIFLDSSFFKRKLKNSLTKKYFEENKESLNNPLIQVVSKMRLKMVLLSYLISVPEYFGIPAWSPFLNFNIATTMLRLPKEAREGRQWQKDFFKRENLYIENMNLSFSNTNLLNHTGAKNFFFEPIKPDSFKDILDVRKIDKLNRQINKKNKVIEFILTRMKLGSVLRRCGVKKIGYLGTLSNYYTIKAIEKSIENES
jgi:hypothetical protein